MAYQFDFAAVLQHSDLLLQGAAFTLGLTAVGTLLGVSLGIVGAVLRAWHIRPFNHLFGVYVDAKGKAQRISDSAYDVNSRNMLFSVNHFSVYGVGYTAPSAKFTDINSHWSKEAIDYVVGRGLFSGTTNTPSLLIWRWTVGC